MFPKIGVPQNGWFILENPIKMDDLGETHYFWKHPNGSIKVGNMCFQNASFSVRYGTLMELCTSYTPCGCFPKIVGFSPQIIHLFIGFSLIFTIHFEVPLFLETSIYSPEGNKKRSCVFHFKGCVFGTWMSQEVRVNG